MKNLRMLFFGMVGLAVILLVAACGADATATPTAKPAAVAPAPTPTPSAFEQLVAEARASDHVVRMAMEGVPRELVERYEKIWEDKFGFPLILENEPGHTKREVPVKVAEAGAAGRGVVDYLISDIGNLPVTYDANLMRKPNWDALNEGFPILADLRANMPSWDNSLGEPLTDYCISENVAGWSFAYNTNNLTDEEVAGLAGASYDILTTPEWKDRVVWDARALGLYMFPFAPGWDQARLEDFAERLGANGLKLFPGGSNGVIQALIQGEGDIGVASVSVASRNIAQGAPIGVAFPEFVSTSWGVSCLPKFGVNNEAMADLMVAMYPIDMFYGSQDLGGSFRIFSEEADKFPMAGLFAAAGLTSKNLITARSPDEVALTGGYRAAAIAAMQKGIESQ
jgi:hypothetical protein